MSDPKKPIDDDGFDVEFEELDETDSDDESDPTPALST
jgi:hypothetical protein